jgi:hypothetical protein
MRAIDANGPAVAAGTSPEQWNSKSVSARRPMLCVAGNSQLALTGIIVPTLRRDMEEFQ